MITLIILICILIIIAIIIYHNKSKVKKLIPLTIDDIEILERNPEQINYIKQLSTDNKLSNEQADLYSRRFQFYNTIDDKSITKAVINGQIQPEPIDSPTPTIEITRSLNINPARNVIDNGLTPPNTMLCSDVEVLNEPLYLKNYYYDLFGNRVNADLIDYFANYQTQIDSPDINTKCVKTTLTPTGSGIIIPNQYPTLKYQTNAYNIDWSKIINPLTYY